MHTAARSSVLHTCRFKPTCTGGKGRGETSSNTTINSHEDKRSEDSSDIHTARACQEEALHTLKSRAPSGLFYRIIYNLSGYSIIS